MNNMSNESDLSQPVLRNKISPPRLKPNRIHRDQLVRLVEDSIWRKLTLFCAPAGYGKTSVINEWAQTTRYPIAWIQIDDEDNVLHNFIQAFVASVGLNFPDFATSLTHVFQHSLLPTPDLLAHTLLHELEKLPQPLVIVIDDYHLIHSLDIHSLMKELIAHLPEDVHLLMATREEPPFTLARMRAKDEVQEIRVSDLQFSTDEIDQFLNQLHHLGLDMIQIETLFTKTEGWPAGIHLAALSLRDGSDSRNFIDHFSGSNRFILDFLMEEVLDHLEEKTRQFLLRVSILDQFTSSLTDKLTPEIQNPPRLIDLESDNLFITSIDPERTWYRFHPLFADLLRLRLREEAGEEGVKQLLHIAADWEAENKLYPESVQHYLRSGDKQQATNTAIVYASLLLELGESARCIAWLDHLPPECTGSSLGLQLLYGYGSISNSRFDEAGVHAALAQGSLDQVSAYLPVEQKSDIQARIHIIQALVASEKGDLETARRLSDLAVPHLSITDPVRTSLWLGLAAGYQHTGNSQEAIQSLQKAISECTIPEQNGIRLIAQNNLAMIYIEMGEFDRADEISKASLLKTDPRNLEKDPMISISYLYQSFIAYEKNNIAQAEMMTQIGVDLAKRWGNLDVICSLFHLHCLSALAKKDLILAKERFLQYSELAANIPSSQTSHDIYLANHLRFYLMTGDFAGARIFLDQSFNNLERPTKSLAENLWYERAIAEFWLDHRLLVNTRKKLIEIQQRTKDGGRVILHLQISLLLLAEECLLPGQGPNPQEISKLLNQCKEIGIFRSLVDLSTVLHPIFERGLKTDEKDLSVYIQSILNESQKPTEKLVQPGMKSGVDQLSDREIEVLHLLASGLSNTTIAERLVVSPGTIKRHLHNIFAKLGASSRLDAVSRARAQGYLP